MNNLYQKVRKFVKESFDKTDRLYEIPHFERAVYWVEKLMPDADEAIKIATFAHDIERAFRQKDLLEKKETIGYAAKELFRPHEERGAEIIGEFLEKQGADKELVRRVKLMVLRHEEGGTKEQNLLKDADSLSFFDENADYFLEKKLPKIGKARVKEKFDWMYNRMSGKGAKTIALRKYQHALKKLENATSKN